MIAMRFHSPFCLFRDFPWLITPFHFCSPMRGANFFMMYSGRHDETGKSLDKIRPLCYGYSNIKKEEIMTKEQYISITRRTQNVASRLPFGAKAFSIPTYLCAAIYIGTLCLLLTQRDSRFFRRHWFRREFSCW